MNKVKSREAKLISGNDEMTAGRKRLIETEIKTEGIFLISVTKTDTLYTQAYTEKDKDRHAHSYIQNYIHTIIVFETAL